MTFFSPLNIGWLNGWIPIVFFYGVFFVLLRIVPKETVERLYDKTHWTNQQANLARIGLPFALVGIILVLFTPLKIGQPFFWFGLALFLLGLVGFVSSLHTFNITPLAEPVTDGLYNISRNPQWVAFALGIIGTSFMVGSWTVFLLFMVRVLMNHFRIMGEERALEIQYGDSYLEYKKSVPRYLLIF